MQKLIIVLSLLLGVVCPNHAQILVSYAHVNDLSAAQVDSVIGQSGPYGVSIYSVIYTMLDHNELLDTVSGLYCVPIGSAAASDVVIYNHGTTDGPLDAPSLLGSGFSESLAFSSFGFATATPDFIGLGVSTSFHPYVHAESEALAGLYFIDLAYQLMDSINIVAGDKLFLAGYSQGAHASMALQKKIETEFQNDILVTAAAHGSGPYSISDVMYNLVIGDEVYAPVGFVPYFIMGYQEAYGNLYNDISEIFKPAYLAPINEFKNGNIGLQAMTIQLGLTLFFQAPGVIPKYMFQDSILARLVTNNENDPLISSLRENNTFDFQAQIPTRLYYCQADDIVPFENSIYADSAMQQNGAVDLALIHVNPNGSHGACALEAIPMAIDYFLSFTNVGTKNPELSLIEKIYPNPAFDEINIDLKEQGEDITVIISGINGKQLKSVSWNGLNTSINIADLPHGMYLLTLRQNDGFQTIKFIK